MSRIASTDSQSVAFLDSGSLHHYVQFFYLAGYVVILQRSPLVVCQCIQQPVLHDGMFYHAVETGDCYIIHCTIFKILCKDKTFHAQSQKKCAKFYNYLLVVPTLREWWQIQRRSALQVLIVSSFVGHGAFRAVTGKNSCLVG